ncbi:hypothetical protein LCGC14_2130930 [marine sediment metagenome]|uniref:Uncharacterized protein n=1 Tax=marine sediment metagenome TaxID=412755 RepID=A0A0F9GEJ6_9ZZZZ
MSGILELLELLAELLKPALAALRDGRDLSPEERAMVSAKVDATGDRLRKAAGR